MKKEVATFEKTETSYWWNSENSPEFGLVAHFLMTDVSVRSDTTFTDWLYDPEISSIQGNVIEIDLMNEGTIEIRDLLNEGEIDDPVFRMPKEEYRKMVLEWQKIVKQKPKGIIVFWDGKEITVEGKN